MIKETGEMRDRHEGKTGGYKKIYPVPGSEKYDIYIQAADFHGRNSPGLRNSQLVKARTLSTNAKSANICQNCIMTTAPKKISAAKEDLNLFN